MEIRKEAAVALSGAPDEGQLLAINRLAKTPLTAEQVYVFSLRLCDDQVDRDFERFDTQALPRLAELFVGKTGILDHNWSAGQQVARIFQTETLTEGFVTYIKAWAYIRRSPENQSLIGDIEAGIKKEVSVGCAMGEARCSICGAKYGDCEHQKGMEYQGEICTAVLSDPKDAYEFSFVAVPAQKDAGVMKALSGSKLHLEELVRKQAGVRAYSEYQALKKLAEAGREWEKQLRSRVVRLGLALDQGFSEKLLRASAERMSHEELQAWERLLETKIAELYPPAPQLPGLKPENTATHSEYMI